MYGTIKSIRESKNGNDSYKMAVALPSIVETDGKVTITTFKPEPVPVALAKRIEKDLEKGIVVELNMEIRGS